jgi:hypothetical protein
MGDGSVCPDDMARACVRQTLPTRYGTVAALAVLIRSLRVSLHAREEIGRMV